ncbi:MAG: SDR family NAD(P)-dependent oxidoreductase [Rhizobiaceae bacterium]
MSVDREVAIITGAANGIGLATAEAFGRAGFAVALVDLDAGETVAAAGSIAEKTGAPTFATAASVSNFEDSRGAHAAIVDALGPVAVLVNNAGIVVRQKGRLEEISQSEIDEMMAIHVGGTLNWTRLVVPDMRSAGYGRIVNLSSCNAIAAVPYRIAYVTAKKAIQGVTEALAMETARAGITVNAIAPGYILTDSLRRRAEAGILDQSAIAERTPVGRWGRAEEIADAAVFLASRKSSFITGTTLVVDGGLTVRGDSGEDLENSPLAS